jgi:hypothetical protein
MCRQPFPLNRTVEARPRVAVAQVTGGSLRCGPEGLLLNGKSVALVHDHLGRLWFACPECGRLCRHIYLDDAACRICLQLEWDCQHWHRSPLGVSARRAVKWRRQIGIDPQPFADIPKRQRHHKRYFRIVGRIVAEEAKMLGELRRLNRKAANATGMQPE